MCVCALVCLGGGGGAVAHLLAPLLFGVGAHGAGKCVLGAPGPGREAGEPDAEPTGGDVGVGSQPPRHKDKLPNRSTTACWHGKAVVRGTARVRPALLDCLQHEWRCHAGWVRLPTAEGVPRAGGGALGRRECFPALGATGGGCTGCGATAHVDEGAQRAPHPNGLSVVAKGGLTLEGGMDGWMERKHSRGRIPRSQAMKPKLRAHDSDHFTVLGQAASGVRWAVTAPQAPLRHRGGGRIRRGARGA